MFSVAKRGCRRRVSPSDMPAGSSTTPVSKPRPRGEYATKPILSARVVHGVSPANSFRPSLAEAQSADLALFDQPGHGADGVFDRNGRIDAMLVVQIDDLDAQPLETGLARADDIFGTAIGDLAAASADVAELGRQNHFGATPLDGLADEFFVLAGPIGVRRVE